MLRLALITVPLLCLSAFLPASAPALDGPYLKDTDLKKLAQSFNDYIEASVAREGVLKAENVLSSDCILASSGVTTVMAASATLTLPISALSNSALYVTNAPTKVVWLTV